jgi:hypothetical protein
MLNNSRHDIPVAGGGNTQIHNQDLYTQVLAVSATPGF